ncbi:hypothetical protein [Nocardia rhamnosiphila]|uniref:Uncharacterized protein n=1 Tax=Nocardia rhamnosiphila TaxID=426716 RepID=A0ABV2WIV0_9NOCA
MTDLVVQATLKLVLEPIFEADFLPVCYESDLIGGSGCRSPRPIISAPGGVSGRWMRRPAARLGDDDQYHPDDVVV